MTFRNTDEENVNLTRFALEQSNVEKARYVIALYGEPDVELAYVLRPEKSVWAVYTVERGKRYDACYFEKVDGACKYLFWQLINSPNQFSFLKEYKNINQI